MTRIGEHGPGGAGQGAPGFGGDARDADLGHGASARREGRRDPDPSGGLAGGLARDPAPGDKAGPRAEAALLAREAAFQASIRGALARQEPEGDPAAGAEARERVLAVAGPPGPQPLQPAPAPAAAQPAPSPGPAAETLAARVEQALRAEAVAALGGPVSLRLDLGGAVDGVQALAVTLTATSLDVTLVRGAGEVSEALAEAAQALAARLQHRFAKRLVRVLDRVEAEAGRDGAGLHAISRLLDRANHGA